MDDCSPRRCQHPAGIYYFQKFYPFENFQCLEMKAVMIISIKDSNQQLSIWLDWSIHQWYQWSIWLLGSIHQLYQFDKYDYYDLPLTLNLSYFPVSFPESSTRDPYLGETLLWNEKSWIIFRLWALFQQIPANMRFGETFGARKLECKAVDVHEIWAREGSKKKRLRDWGGALKVSSADQHQLLKSRNQQILMRSRWITGHKHIYL